MRVSDVMTRDVFTASPTDNIKSIAVEMAKRNIGATVIVDEGKVVGIVTERDFLKKVVATGADPEKVLAKDIMHCPVVTIHPDLSVIRAVSFMSAKRFRRLPVVEDEKLVGIVTQTDLNNALKKLLDASLKQIIEDLEAGENE